MKTISPLIKPVVECFREPVCSSDLKHADETRWGVWTDDAEDNKKHWLWIFLSKAVRAVYFSINDSRAATVPESVIGESEGTLVCDRYSAYKKLAREHPLIVLAFCWAHVRRDFINTSHGGPGLKNWSFAWLERIARLYYLNGQRLVVREDVPGNGQRQRGNADWRNRLSRLLLKGTLKGKGAGSPTSCSKGSKGA